MIFGIDRPRPIAACRKASVNPESRALRQINRPAKVFARGLQLVDLGQDAPQQ